MAMAFSLIHTVDGMLNINKKFTYLPRNSYKTGQAEFIRFFDGVIVKISSLRKIS